MIATHTPLSAVPVMDSSCQRDRVTAAARGAAYVPVCRFRSPVARVHTQEGNHMCSHHCEYGMTWAV